MTRLKILVVDDHALVRAGLKQTLSSQDDFTIIGECATAAEAMDVLATTACDLVLLDLSLADRSGLDVLQFVRTHCNATAVLVLSGHAESRFGINVLNAGARGYVSKNASEAELLRAIRSVGRGQIHVGSHLSGLLIEQATSGSSGAQHASLSTREFQIFGKLASGNTVTEIARELVLSVKTVSTYRSRILEKMSLSNNADLTRYALEHDLMPNRTTAAAPEP